MAHTRSEKIDSLLRQELAELLLHFFDSKKYGLLTVINVKTAKNFDSARVFVSCLKNSHQFLEDASHKVYKIQKVLNAKLVMRRVPKIIFDLDLTARLGAKLDQLFTESE